MPSRLVTIYWDKQDPANTGWAWRTADDSGPLDAPDEAFDGALFDAWGDSAECRPTDQVYIDREGCPHEDRGHFLVRPNNEEEP